MAKKATIVEVPTLYRVELLVTEDMLGTAPSNREIYSEFIATKALQAEKKLAVTDEAKAIVQAKQDAITEEELAMLPEEGMKGLTVFRRDPSGNLIITDTMIRGFLKEGASAIGAEGSTWGLTSKIDKFVFVTNENKRPIRMLPLLRDGQPITAPDGILERPLRAMTKQGPRIALAASEIVKAPITLSFYITLVGVNEWKSGKPITEEILKSWFSYGQFTGLGQYRTGGHGRFDATVTAL